MQQGKIPPGAKAVATIGSGVWEIRIAANDSWFRVFYLANLGGKVYILHGFQKKSNQTPRNAVETGRRRYRIAIEESSAPV